MLTGSLFYSLIQVFLIKYWIPDQAHVELNGTEILGRGDGGLTALLKPPGTHN